MKAIGSRKWYWDSFFISVVISFFRIITAECPPDILIKPCKCAESEFTIIECAGITNMQTLIDIFGKTADRKFHNLALFDSNLQYIPSSAVVSKNIEQILISNVTLISMFDHSPDPSNNVSLIEIERSKFLRGVGWDKFVNLKKLKAVSVKNAEINSLGKSFVDNLSDSVEIFYLFNCKVRKLQYNAFSHMMNLYDLQVKNTGIKFLRRSLFPTPSKLKVFSFPENKIDTLPEDLFTEMPDLQFIELSGNKISTISEDVFGNVYNTLKLLKMDNNPVVCDCSLRWYISRDREILEGQCAGPEDRKGKSFHDLSQGDFTYCT